MSYIQGFGAADDVDIAALLTPENVELGFNILTGTIEVVGKFFQPPPKKGAPPKAPPTPTPIIPRRFPPQLRAPPKPAISPTLLIGGGVAAVVALAIVLRKK